MGPSGAGPMTGRGMGACAGNRAQSKPRGNRCGGNGRGYFQARTQPVLEAKIDDLQTQLTLLEKKLSEKLNIAHN